MALEMRGGEGTMEETMALEMRGLGLEGGMFVPAPSWEIFTMPKPELAARVKGKTKRAFTKPELPKVVAVTTERLDEEFIEWLQKNPIKRPVPRSDAILEFFPKQPESLAAAFAAINRAVDVREDIAKQYKEKGYAIVGVELLDNGRKRLFSLPEDAAAA
ncbi:unnamed protein product [Urochloa humidicola]